MISQNLTTKSKTKYFRKKILFLKILSVFIHNQKKEVNFYPSIKIYLVTFTVDVSLFLLMFPNLDGILQNFRTIFMNSIKVFNPLSFLTVLSVYDGI
jgi:hypothetical protein